MRITVLRCLYWGALNMETAKSICIPSALLNAHARDFKYHLACEPIQKPSIPSKDLGCRGKIPKP